MREPREQARGAQRRQAGAVKGLGRARTLNPVLCNECTRNVRESVPQNTDVYPATLTASKLQLALRDFALLFGDSISCEIAKTYLNATPSDEESADPQHGATGTCLFGRAGGMHACTAYACQPLR